MKTTITSSTEISSLFGTADRYVQKNLILFVAREQPQRDQAGRVAFLAGKRLGSAPKRNRAKRLLREAARLEGAPWLQRRCLLVARGKSYELHVDEVRKQLRRALSECDLP